MVTRRHAAGDRTRSVLSHAHERGTPRHGRRRAPPAHRNGGSARLGSGVRSEARPDGTTSGLAAEIFGEQPTREELDALASVLFRLGTNGSGGPTVQAEPQDRQARARAWHRKAVYGLAGAAASQILRPRHASALQCGVRLTMDWTSGVRRGRRASLLRAWVRGRAPGPASADDWVRWGERSGLRWPEREAGRAGRHGRRMASARCAGDAGRSHPTTPFTLLATVGTIAGRSVANCELQSCRGWCGSLWAVRASRAAGSC